jgi:sugar lactone lactonase YvrE
MNLEVASDAKAALGEGPSWDVRSKILYWVDIVGGLIYAHTPGSSSDEIVAPASGVSCVVPRKSGGLALTLPHGFFGLDLSTKKLEAISVSLESDIPTNRFNDGKCDPAGRFWAGTMDEKEKNPAGSLYLLGTDRSLKKVLSGVTISNGLGWSPDRKTMYYIDSPTRKVWSFDYSHQTGDISNKRTAADFDEAEQPGVPDGMAVDAEGMIWVAHWGGARVSRWNPVEGKLVETLPVPADHVTSCCFAGSNLDELYITSAREGFDQTYLAKMPLSGSLFVANVGVKGLPTYAFEG